MAITNREIITMEMALRGIMEDVDTYAGWQRKGMQVQRGMKAMFVTQIWKPCKSKVSNDVDAEEKQEKQGEQKNRKMIMVKAAFFGISQVEPIKK